MVFVIPFGKLASLADERIEVHHTRKCSAQRTKRLSNQCICNYQGDQLCRVANITCGRFMITQQRRNGRIRYFTGANETRTYMDHKWNRDPIECKTTQWRWHQVYTPMPEHNQLLQVLSALR